MKTQSALTLAKDEISAHFEGHLLAELVTVVKIFPETTRPDFEAGIEAVLQCKARFLGVDQSNSYRAMTFNGILSERRDPPVITPAQYMDIDIGEAESGRCVTTGLWLFHVEGAPAALLVSQQDGRYGEQGGVRVEAVMSAPAGGPKRKRCWRYWPKRLLSARSIAAKRFLLKRCAALAAGWGR